MYTGSFQKRILDLEGLWKTHNRVKEMVENVCPGCELVTADNGSHALQMIKDEPFDLVIVDPWAAEVTGFKICRYVSANRPSVPVFFYAQKAHMNDRKFAESSGAAAFFLTDDSDGLAQAMVSALG